MVNIGLVSMAILFVPCMSDLEYAAFGRINLHMRSSQERAKVMQVFLHTVSGVTQEYDIVRKQQRANFPLSQIKRLHKVIHCDVK